MKLKAISIAGFKTFADRVNIQFHDGITGIIGPNGSGKSNAIAAVRWVMGEQSAKNLRDPAEIIFAGSQTRKHLSSAEVTLTFTNDGKGCPAEFIHLPEISIGRRIFRDGDREYFMNREPCRLKDIVDFLLAVGLGAHGYSIIEQEKRDRIIQASPDTLREILEETAGITIFKKHRNEAEKRLNSTAEKMSNLGEIQNELEKQSGALKEQAEKVEQRKGFLDALRDCEIRQICYRVGLFRQTARKIQTEVTKISTEVQLVQVSSTEWEVRANDCKSEQMELRTHIGAQEDLLEEKKLAKTKYAERSDNIYKRKEERTKRKDGLSKRLEDERQTLINEEKRMQECIDLLEVSDKEARRIDGELESLEYQLDEADEGMQVDKTRAEELRSEIRATSELLKTLQGRNEGLLERIERTNGQIQRTDDLLSEAKTHRSQILSDHTSTESQLASLTSGMQEIAAAKVELDEKLKTLINDDELLRTQRDQAKGDLLEINSTLASLQKLTAANEGLSDGARVLRTKMQAFIKGLVYEQIKVHPDDESIIESALPNLLQTTFIENTDTLVELLDKIEEQNISKVDLILEDLVPAIGQQEDEIRRNILASSGARCVGDRINSDAPTLIKRIFSRIFIVRDEWLIFKALRVAGDLAPLFIFISERGVVVSGGIGLNFGKTSEQGQGLLQRKRAVEELIFKKEEAQKKLAQAEGSLFSFGENKKALERDLAIIDAKLSQEKVEILKLTSALENFNLKLRHVDENIQRMDQEKQRIASDMTSDRQRYAENQDQIDRYERELLEFRRDLDDAESVLEDKRDVRETVLGQIQSRKQERGIIDERSKNHRNNYEDLKIHVKRLQQNVDKGLLELSELESQMTSSTDEEESLMRELDRLHFEIGALQEKLTAIVSREAELEEEMRVLDNKIKSQKDATVSRQKQIQDKSMELARCQAILDTAEKEASERFGLIPQELPSEIEEVTGFEGKMDKEIVTYRKTIEELGPVNERAQEEYNAVEDRRNFLTSQKDDIEKSVAELQKAILEIEETTKNRFKEIYDEVNKEFQGLFPILFPGGEARLELVNPNDLLTTGVEILVRLPGKRLQRMHLFSGGEKALTAISLIFALLKTHPAPFCFLDEVDAPLDEANVGRFNAVLESLASEFQFVLITHNRRTMEVLDTIYGISMQEPGVSKLVAVDFSEVPDSLRKKKKERVGASAGG